MTVSRLRTELTDAELLHYAAYFELKNEQQEKEMRRSQVKRR